MIKINRFEFKENRSSVFFSIDMTVLDEGVLGEGTFLIKTGWS